MKRSVFVLFMLVVMSMMTAGCGTMSYLSYSSSKDEIIRGRVYASGNREAIKDMHMGVKPETAAIKAFSTSSGDVGIGIDLLAMDVITQHPWRQLGAAVVDLASMYATYRGIESLTDNSHDNGNDNSTTGNQNADVTISNGDGGGNTTTVNVNIGNETAAEGEGSSANTN